MLHKHVVVQGGFTAESLVTVGTTMRLHVRVGLLVSLQKTAERKPFSTLVTLEFVSTAQLGFLVRIQAGEVSFRVIQGWQHRFQP